MLRNAWIIRPLCIGIRILPNDEFNCTRLRAAGWNAKFQTSCPRGRLEIEIIRRKIAALPTEWSQYNRRGRGGCSAQPFEPGEPATSARASCRRSADRGL